MNKHSRASSQSFRGAPADAWLPGSLPASYVLVPFVQISSVLTLILFQPLYARRTTSVGVFLFQEEHMLLLIIFISIFIAGCFRYLFSPLRGQFKAKRMFIRHLEAKMFAEHPEERPRREDQIYLDSLKAEYSKCELFEMIVFVNMAVLITTFGFVLINVFMGGAIPSFAPTH
jgi:hypothetical protein